MLGSEAQCGACSPGWGRPHTVEGLEWANWSDWGPFTPDKHLSHLSSQHLNVLHAVSVPDVHRDQPPVGSRHGRKGPSSRAAGQRPPYQEQAPSPHVRPGWKAPLSALICLSLPPPPLLGEGFDMLLVTLVHLQWANIWRQLEKAARATTS